MSLLGLLLVNCIGRAGSESWSAKLDEYVVYAEIYQLQVPLSPRLILLTSTYLSPSGPPAVLRRYKISAGVATFSRIEAT